MPPKNLTFGSGSSQWSCQTGAVSVRSWACCCCQGWSWSLVSERRAAWCCQGWTGWVLTLALSWIGCSQRRSGRSQVLRKANFLRSWTSPSFLDGSFNYLLLFLWIQRRFSTCASTPHSRAKKSRRLPTTTVSSITEARVVKPGKGLRGVLELSPMRESPPGPSCTAWSSDHAQGPGVTDFMQVPRKVLPFSRNFEL